MNKRQAFLIGREIGHSIATWVEVPHILSDWEMGVPCDACSEAHNHPVDYVVCQALAGEANGRQFADSLTYDLAREPNSESLFDAYDDGIYRGALKEARQRCQNLFTRRQLARLGG